MKIFIILLFSQILLAQDFEMAVIDKGNNELVNCFLSIKAVDANIDDLIPEFTRLVGYTYKIEQKIYSGPSYNLTITAGKISAYDLLQLMCIHMTPHKKINIDNNNRVLLFSNE